MEKSQLLKDICETLVSEGGYRMVWLGYDNQDEAKSVRPVAHAGFEKGYLETASITWADTERGKGPPGTAIHTGKPVVNQDFQTESHFAPWQ